MNSQREVLKKTENSSIVVFIENGKLLTNIQEIFYFKTITDMKLACIKFEMIVGLNRSSSCLCNEIHNYNTLMRFVMQDKNESSTVKFCSMKCAQDFIDLLLDDDRKVIKKITTEYTIIYNK